MKPIRVVTESHWDGDDKEDLDILEIEDVQDLINESLGHILQEFVTEDEIKIIKKTLREKASKADLDKVRGSFETLETDVKAIVEEIAGMPRTFEQHFKRIIIDNLSHPFAIFAKQIKQIETSQKKMQELLNEITSKEKEVKKTYDAIKKIHAEIKKTQKEEKPKEKKPKNR